MPRRIAYKRLSSVEVDPEASHQHEFNAGALRRDLGFAHGRHTGPFYLTVFPSDDPTEAASGVGRFTIYDARERHPDRSEYRLYYDTPDMILARQGDLLVLFRQPDGAISAFIARPGTAVERQLLNALRTDAASDRLQLQDDPTLGADAPSAIADAIRSDKSVPPDYLSASSDFVSVAVQSGTIPRSSELSAAAEQAVLAVHGQLGADSHLYHVLEAESDLYFMIEKQVLESRVSQAIGESLTLTELLGLAQSVLQSRRSRRGLSLQNHFARLLDSRSIPYSSQCETEPGEVADFVIPGCTAYHTPDYPASRLRMVACKTTAKERWRQVLNEAERIRGKHLLTIDTRITRGTLVKMKDSSLIVSIPAPIITAHYATWAAELITVNELLETLRSVA